MHFDSHIFTLVTPVIIPKTKSSESGQLITFPNLRVEPIGEIYNIISKLYYKFFITGKKNVTKFSGKIGATGNLSSFNGRRYWSVRVLSRLICYTLLVTVTAFTEDSETSYFSIPLNLGMTADSLAGIPKTLI